MRNRDFILIFIVLFLLTAVFYFSVVEDRTMELKSKSDIFDNFSVLKYQQSEIDSGNLDKFGVQNKIKSEINCVTKIEDRLVRGNSLSGLIEDGASVKILFGFYDCHEIKREDIVVYRYAGNKNPIIKIVKAVPGDTFQLKQSLDGWNILVNNEILKNSLNQPYILDVKGYKMLSLYEKDYKGIIPKDAYLILGNLANGSLDGSSFGLIDKSDILGKVSFSEV